VPAGHRHPPRRILFDGDLGALTARFAGYKTITVALQEPLADPGRYGELVSAEGGRVVLKVGRAEASSVAARLLADHLVTDLTIEDPPIDDVIDLVFSGQAGP
jgi:ABC-2 type transport system ATP-binding protein